MCKFSQYCFLRLANIAKKREYCFICKKKQTEIFKLSRKELFLQFRIRMIHKIVL